MLGQIGIVGNGSWGTALAKILTDNGQRISWWIRNKESLAYLQTREHNPHYLTSVHFSSDKIQATDDLQKLLTDCQTIIIAVPSAYAQQAIESVNKKLWEGKNIVSAIKGILPDCNLLLNDYLSQYPGFD